MKKKKERGENKIQATKTETKTVHKNLIKERRAKVHRNSFKFENFSSEETHFVLCVLKNTPHI